MQTKTKNMFSGRIEPEVYKQIKEIADEEGKIITRVLNKILILGLTAYRQGK
jgi:hypothetical protein